MAKRNKKNRPKLKPKKDYLALIEAKRAEKEEERKVLGQKIADEIEACAGQLDKHPSQLIWLDFREYINFAWGKNSAEITPKDITRAGGFNAIRDAYFPPQTTEVSVEKAAIKAHARANRKLGSELNRLEWIFNKIEDYSDRIFKGRIEQYKSPGRPRIVVPTQRVVNVMLSDLHIGSDIKQDETGSIDFGVLQESRRLASITKQIGDYKSHYRDETELELLLLGDIIQNRLHDANDGAAVAEQMARALHLLLQMVSYLASRYKKINVRCATGNHGRNTGRHKERATHQKWDSLETFIYYSLMKACSEMTNVEFHIPKTPFVTYEHFGKKSFFTHGDTVLNPGNPGKNIGIKSLGDQINSINAALKDMDEYVVFGVGHVHTASQTFMQSGATMFTNGPMVPPDDFAVSIGILECNCGQWLWESVEGHPVGDSRLMKVNSRVDRDASLDSIIKPWKGFDK
jgi:hypothetical protein